MSFGFGLCFFCLFFLNLCLGFPDTESGSSVQVAGCLGILDVLPVRTDYLCSLSTVSPAVLERYQPYSAWAKRKICTCPVRLMHAGASDLAAHVCILPLGGPGEKLS